MSDITMCSSNNCPIRATCYRSRAKADKNQSWYNFEYTCHEYNGYPDYMKTEAKVSEKIYKSYY